MSATGVSAALSLVIAQTGSRSDHGTILSIAAIGIATLLAAMWCVLPPTSRAAKASWLILVVGVVVSQLLLLVGHRAAAFLSVLSIVSTAPLAVWRRSRPSSEGLSASSANRALAWMIAAGLLFAFGLNQLAIQRGTLWPATVIHLAAWLVIGVLPFHRPLLEMIRMTPSDVRAPVCLVAGPVVWLTLGLATPETFGRIQPPLIHLARPWPVLTLWLGALLFLSRGDLPRIVAAVFLLTAGRVHLLLGAPIGLTLAGGIALSQAVPLLVVVMLLSKLERLSGTQDTSELGGLLNATPRLGAVLFVSVMWFCVPAGFLLYGELGRLWLNARYSRPLSPMQLWPLIVPQAITVWAGVRFLSDLLLGIPRSPSFPEQLLDRAPQQVARPVMSDLTVWECVALTVVAVPGLVMTLVFF